LVNRGGSSLQLLDSKHILALIALQERPFATIAELAERVGVSRPTMKKKIEFLEGKQGHPFFYVIPLLNCDAMQLEQIDILIDVSSFDDVLRLEKLAVDHPYTAYKSRCYGAYNGAFLQFRVPRGTSHLVDDLVDTMTLKGQIRKYALRSVEPSDSIFTSMSVDAWNMRSMSWNFDWTTWFDSSVRKGRGRIRQDVQDVFQWLKKEDLFILQQLMMNARRNNRRIIDAMREQGAEITPQTFGRRLKLIQKSCVDGYRVTFDPETFDVISSILIMGNSDETYLKELRRKMVNNPIPFESTFRTTDDHLFWFVRLSPNHLSTLIEKLHPHLENMSVTMLDYTKSTLFAIWPETYDEQTKYWRTDEKFMLHDVLK
jgi:DNA-binding Lrp family transcriptional regulator